jgi:hypothetical protein
MPLDEAYLIWLYSQVGEVNNKNRSKTYWKLLRLLHEKEFTWLIPKDENRAQEGKDLRREFLRQTKTKMDEPGWLDFGASFLEVLVALSWKLSFEGGGEQADRFWELIGNLGLQGCTDANPPENVIIDHILNIVINREYAANGAGGLFPIDDTDKDQRVVELWYQMQTYLLAEMN